MKPLLNTTLLFLLVIGFSGGVSGQNNGQLGFICVDTNDQTALPRVFKVNMEEGRVAGFDWAAEEFDSGAFSVEVDYIYTRVNSFTFYIDRITLEGGPVRDDYDYSCSLSTWTEIDRFVQREISKLNNVRAF